MSLTLWAARTPAQAERAGAGPVVWLGPGPAPASVADRQVALPEDPTNLEGWLELRRWAGADGPGGSAKELLVEDGVSLWWFANHWMLYGEGLPSYDELYRALSRIRAAALAERPGAIVLLSALSTDHLAARAVARSVGAIYRWRIPARDRWAAAASLRWKVRLLTGLRLGKLAVRGVLARRRPAPSPGPDLVFNCSSTTWNEASASDRVLQPLLDAAAGHGLRTLGLYLDHRRSLGLFSLRRLSGPVVPWERYITPAGILGASRTARRLRDRWPSGAEGAFAGLPAGDVLGHRIEALLRARLRDALIAVDSAARATRELAPRSIVLTDSYDMWPRALVVAGRRQGVRVVEVQHAIIGRNHGGYLHLPGEVAEDGGWTASSSPLPEAICLYGESSRRALLTSGRIPERLTHVTGALAIEAARRRAVSRESLRAALGAHPEHTVVSFFGVPEHLWPYDAGHLRAFLMAVPEVSDALIVLRPHPGDPSNPARYRAALAAAGLPGHVASTGDPWDLIIASDIVLAYNSTAIYDAAALGRSVVHVNLSGVPDLLPVVEEAGALTARSPEELARVLHGLSDRAAREAQAARQSQAVASVFAQVGSPSAAILALAVAP